MLSNQDFSEYDSGTESPSTLKRQWGQNKSRAKHCKLDDSEEEEMVDTFEIMKSHNKKRQKRSFQKKIHSYVEEWKEDDDFENFFDDEPISSWDDPIYPKLDSN